MSLGRPNQSHGPQRKFQEKSVQKLNNFNAKIDLKNRPEIVPKMGPGGSPGGPWEVPGASRGPDGTRFEDQAASDPRNVRKKRFLKKFLVKLFEENLFDTLTNTLLR